jgi:DnaJ-class molecular chaperone
MSSYEGLIIAGCLIAGYVFMSRILAGRDETETTENAKPNGEEPEQTDQSYSQSNPAKQIGSLSLRSCYDTLGVNAGARPDEIRLAYKRKMAEYHPDKVMSLGEKIRDAAEQEAKRINQAYDYLQLRGYA